VVVTLALPNESICVAYMHIPKSVKIATDKSSIYTPPRVSHLRDTSLSANITLHNICIFAYLPAKMSQQYSQNQRDAGSRAARNAPVQGLLNFLASSTPISSTPHHQELPPIPPTHRIDLNPAHTRNGMHLPAYKSHSLRNYDQAEAYAPYGSQSGHYRHERDHGHEARHYQGAHREVSEVSAPAQAPMMELYADLHKELQETNKAVASLLSRAVEEADEDKADKTRDKQELLGKMAELRSAMKSLTSHGENPKGSFCA
jgi:hypothetical protein